MSKELAVVSALCISISLLLLILILVNKWDNLFFIISGTFALAGVIAGGIAGAPVAKAGMVSVYKYISKPKFTSVTPFENTTVSAFNGVAVDEGDRPQRLRQRAQVPLRQRNQMPGLPGMPEMSEMPEMPEILYDGISEYNKRLIAKIKYKGWDLETDRFEPGYRHDYIVGGFMNALLKAMSDNNKIKFKFHNIIGTFSYHTSDSETPMTQLNKDFEGTLSWGDIIDFTIFDDDDISARAHTAPPPIKMYNIMYNNNEALMFMHEALLLSLGGRQYLKHDINFNNSLLLRVMQDLPSGFIGYNKKKVSMREQKTLARHSLDDVYDKVVTDYNNMLNFVPDDTRKDFVSRCTTLFKSLATHKTRYPDLSEFLVGIYMNQRHNFDDMVNLIFNFPNYPKRVKPDYQVLYERIMPTVTPPTVI
jgi:hypothetical protein